jgi:hypothetical protein
MQIGQQIVNLLIREHVAETVHFVSSHPNDVSRPLVVRGHAARWKIVSFEQAFQARALPLLRGIGGMAAVAILVVDVSSGGLPRSESEFGIASAPLDVASSTEHEQKHGSANLRHGIRAADLTRLLLKRKNRSHQNDSEISSVIPHHKTIPRSLHYQQGLCEIFTIGNSAFIAIAKFKILKKSSKTATKTAI